MAVAIRARQLSPVELVAALLSRIHQLNPAINAYCTLVEDASLSVYTQRGSHYCHCFSAHSDCRLAEHCHNDAFNVYCIGEGVDAKAALWSLNTAQFASRRVQTPVGLQRHGVLQCGRRVL